MRYLLAFCVLFVLSAFGPGLAVTRRLRRIVRSADVSLIGGVDHGIREAKAFDKPFGDSEYITNATAAILYTDVEGVTVPAQAEARSYDFIKPRMELIQAGNKVDPAVLITRSIADDPKEGRIARAVRKAVPGERYYYIEVAIGNRAWHWMKVRLYEVEGKLKVEIVRSTVS